MKFERRSRPLRFTLALLCAAWVGSASLFAQTSGLPLTGLNGERLTEGDLARGRHVLVVWASWSPKCRDIVDRVNGLVERWSSQAAVATVNFQEDSAEIRAFLRGSTLRAPVFLDPEGRFSKAHSVTALPGLVVFVDGRVVHQGRWPTDVDRLLGEILK